MPDPIALYALAADVLAAAEDALNGLLPAGYHHSRVHVVNGPPAIDGWVEDGGCVEHLVAWVEGVAPTTEHQFPEAVSTPLDCHEKIAAVTVVVQVIRCEPTHTVEDGHVVFPASADLDEAARIVLVESWAVWQGLERWARIQGDDDDERPVVMIGQTPVPPQGGVAGTETRLIVATLPDCPMGPVTEPIQWAELPEDFLPDAG